MNYYKCYRKNMDNESIDRIYILDEEDSNTYDIHHINNYKLKFIPMKSRAKFADFFHAIDENNINDNTIHIIANSDLYFDESIQKLQDYNLNYNKEKPMALALSRHDIDIYGNSHLFFQPGILNYNNSYCYCYIVFYF